MKAIQGITQQIAQLPSHYLKIGKFSQSPLYKALKKIFQDYGKTLDFYASPIKNKTTSLSFALFVLLVHNFLLSLGLQ
ncbi:hypothetical protein DXD55_03490, partial [Bacteroides stercoris]